MEGLKHKFTQDPYLPLDIITKDSGRTDGTVHFSLSPGSVEMTIVIGEELQQQIIPAYLIYGLNTKVNLIETIALVVSDKGIISPEKVTITSADQEMLLELESEYPPGKILVVVTVRITRKDISPLPSSECRPNRPSHSSHPFHPHSHHRHINPFI